MHFWISMIFSVKRGDKSSTSARSRSVVNEAQCGHSPMKNAPAPTSRLRHASQIAWEHRKTLHLKESFQQRQQCSSVLSHWRFSSTYSSISSAIHICWCRFACLQTLSLLGGVKGCTCWRRGLIRIYSVVFVTYFAFGCSERG